MRVKQLQYGTAGLLLGLLFGVLVGFGELNMTKKSLRDKVMLPVVGMTTALCAIAGYRIGSNMGRTAYIEEVIGQTTARDTYLKDGRYSVGITFWTDKRDGVQHQLMTARSHSGVLVTALDSKTIINHEVRSASKDTVPKHHAIAKAVVFKTLTNNFQEEAQPMELLLPALT